MSPARYFFLFASLLLFASCANQVAPQGGEKDIKPPKIITSSPENFSTNFNSKKIEISFDEYIQLKDLPGQLIVSPPLSKNPEGKIKKKILVIELDDTLRPNTTYTMNFGNSIVDYNEGNVLEDFQYVFSTGNIIDSLKISGKVENAFDKKTEKGILVMLYKEHDDSLPLKRRPDYFAKTNGKGEFIITNIAEGSYKIFALKESNADYAFNTPEESIAFPDSTVGSDSKGILLRLFAENPRQHLLKGVSEEPGKAVVIFAQPAQDISYKFITDTGKINLAFVEASKKRDTLIFWYKNINLDSLVLFFSNTTTIHDTVVIRLFKSDGKTFSRRKNVLSITPSVLSGQTLDLNKDLLLRFIHPVSQSDFSKISLKEDSVPVTALSVAFSDSLKKNLRIQYKWKEKTTYALFIPSSAFTDILGMKNDTLITSFSTGRLTDYGTLALKLKLRESNRHYIILLMDDKDVIQRSSDVGSDTTLNFDFLQPGIYHLKVIEDLNNNGEWDAGNYFQKRQPEKVAYYPEGITVRANWDVDVKWAIDVGN